MDKLPEVEEEDALALMGMAKDYTTVDEVLRRYPPKLDWPKDGLRLLQAQRSERARYMQSEQEKRGKRKKGE